MRAPSKHLHHLAVEIGPRPPTSTSEALAAEYCRRVFEEAGVRPKVEPFRGLPSFGHTYVPITLGMLAGALLGATKRGGWLGPALGAASLGAFWGENTKRWRPLSERLARAPSQNVVAVIPAVAEARRRLVLTAHVDSSRSGWMFHPKLAPGFRQSVFLGLAAAAAAVAAGILPRLLRRLVSGSAAAVLTQSLLMQAQREIYGRDVAGANDNASGAAVLLSLAEDLALQPPHHTEVWCLITGCEESDTVGMVAFMDQHQDDLEDTWFLGFDTVAGPKATLRWITNSGMLDPLRADPYLVRLASEAAGARPELKGEPGIWQTATLDTDVPAVRGFPAMSLVALTPEGTLPNWHWPTDTFENIDENTLEACYQLAADIVRRFDADS